MQHDAETHSRYESLRATGTHIPMNKTTRTILTAALSLLLFPASLRAAHTTFFFPFQVATNVASGATSDTISSSGYQFTYSLDKWWYAEIAIGPGVPTGRFQSVLWPDGVDAQTLTAGPSGLLANQGPATITIKRLDGTPFDVSSFSAKILGNTAGAGASFEVMPTLNGVDGFPDPLMFDATGIAGHIFSYDTPTLTGFDTYNLSLWMDFALTGLVLVDASPAPPATLFISWSSANEIRLSWSIDATGYALQSSPDVAPAHFTNTGVVPTIQGGLQVVTLSATNACQLFRLVQ